MVNEWYAYLSLIIFLILVNEIIQTCIVLKYLVACISLPWNWLISILKLRYDIENLFKFNIYLLTIKWTLSRINLHLVLVHFFYHDCSPFHSSMYFSLLVHLVQCFLIHILRPLSVCWHMLHTTKCIRQYMVLTCTIVTVTFVTAVLLLHLLHRESRYRIM